MIHELVIPLFTKNLVWMSFDNARMGNVLIAAAHQTHCSFIITNWGLEFTYQPYPILSALYPFCDGNAQSLYTVHQFGDISNCHTLFLIILDLHLKQSIAMEVPSTFRINCTMKETNNTINLFVLLSSKNLSAS